MSAAEVQKIAKLTVDALKGMRSDDAFKLFFKLVESIREKTDTEEANLPRKRKEPRRLEVGDMPWPIMLKFLPILLLSSAQNSYLLCSILCPELLRLYTFNNFNK